MKRLAEILASADERALGAERNPEAQRRVADKVMDLFRENPERIRMIWDDVATELATPLFTYLKAKNEAVS